MVSKDFKKILNQTLLNYWNNITKDQPTYRLLYGKLEIDKNGNLKLKL